MEATDTSVATPEAPPETEPMDATPSTEATDTTTAAVDTSAPGDAEASAEGGSCTITVTGDVEQEVTYPQDPLSINTEYWLTEEQIRESIEFLEIEDTYEDFVSRDEPVLLWMEISCGAEYTQDTAGPSVLLASTDGTKGAQMPMGPGTYAVSGGIFDIVGTPGTVIAGFNLSPEEPFSTVDGSGELVITSWDKSAIEGTVTFEVEEAFVDQPRHATVQMDFSYICADSPSHMGCG